MNKSPRACKVNSNTQKAMDQVPTNHLESVSSPPPLWSWCCKQPPPHPPPTQENKQTKRRKQNRFSIFSVSFKHSLTPPQTAALTQDKPALGASGSQSAEWLVDPAPEPNVNKALTLLGCFEKKENTALGSAGEQHCRFYSWPAADHLMLHLPTVMS